MPGPLAVVEEVGNLQRLASLTIEAEAAGLRVGQPLRDARAMCPALVTRAANPLAEAAFLTSLRRWAGKFSPWVAEEPPAGLIVDLTGCAHLFGGEEALMAQVAADCADLGLSRRAGLADTAGAAWALAHQGGGGVPVRSGDAIDQEARATRSRATRRRSGADPGPRDLPSAAPGAARSAVAGRIAAPGRTRSALGPLPVSALRLAPETVTGLARLGLTRVEDLMGLPRAALARRFGREVVLRLDQALGVAPEPVSPARAPLHFAARMTFPDPIGLPEDIIAAIDRLLARLCLRLTQEGRGVRRLRFQAFRADHTVQSFDLGLARPGADPAALRPLLLLKVPLVEPGFGIDTLRLEAVQTEPVHDRQHKGHFDAASAAMAPRTADRALADLIGKIGARMGLEAITRLHPADSHIPEKAAQVLAAAWSEPADDWPAPPAPRPLLLFRPERIAAPETPALPEAFRWRGRDLVPATATGPERIAPEWWLDDPEWRSGLRDYWRVDLVSGERLWLFYAHGSAVSGGWFCQGSFA